MTDADVIRSIRERVHNGNYILIESAVNDVRVLLEIIQRRSEREADATAWNRYAELLQERVNTILANEPKLPNYATSALTVASDAARSIAKELRKK